MNSREPPKPAVILATPVNVEESRAQRLQRQQARFRDRGGIFVPSSRNTLADILLGKALPLKRPHRSRSVSASPTKGRGHTGNSTAQDLNVTALHAASRRSPRKHGRPSALSVDVEDGGANTTVISVEPVKKTDGAKASKQDLQPKPKRVTKSTSKASIPKVASTSTKKIKKTENGPPENVGNVKPVPKSKGSKASTSKTSKVSAAREEFENSDGDLPVPMTKSKSKAPRKPRKPKVPKATGSQVAKDVKTKGKPTVSARNSEATSSMNALHAPSPPTRSRPRKSDLYSDGFSEDEYVPKAAARPAKAGAKSTLSNKPKPASSKLPSAPSKRNQKGIAGLPDIPEENEDWAEDQEGADGVHSLATKENAIPEPRTNASKGKKRVAQDAELEQEPPEPPKKRLKKSDKGGNSADPESSKAKTQKKGSTKRPRTEDIADESNKKATKRKKGADDSESDAVEGTKTSRPRSQKFANGATKPSCRQATKTAKRKENSSAPALSKVQGKAAVRKGPPKSVLQRIKDSRPDDADNEPDPIDFLS
ncbi:hypothetical protein GALMADRAFT_245561 [Galerina marginata CBS 339.88]|uniref:Uncharacterized protein n=1 Tax=Galerina marginata (strain CBS 339.88) TaxID=685588 RepID=A0A067T7R2_GALM3|nr:hypothetical protein GALMADRAFT_245561 [Galerina marginata CBS 339.88]